MKDTIFKTLLFISIVAAASHVIYKSLDVKIPSAGEKVTLAKPIELTGGSSFDPRDKHMLLYFYSPDCTSCRVDAPILTVFYKHKLRDLDIELIGVKQNKGTAQKGDIFAIGAKTVNNSLFQKFNIRTIPYYLLIKNDRVFLSTGNLATIIHSDL